MTSVALSKIRTAAQNRDTIAEQFLRCAGGISSAEDQKAWLAANAPAAPGYDWVLDETVQPASWVYQALP